MDLKEQTSFKFIKASCVNEGTDEIQLMEHEDRARILEAEFAISPSRMGNENFSLYGKIWN